MRSKYGNAVKLHDKELALSIEDRLGSTGMDSFNHKLFSHLEEFGTNCISLYSANKQGHEDK